jgi:dTDP-4-amino-4,6-dideoxygalactose transaminase
MRRSEKPAILGGEPILKETVPIAKPPIKAHADKILKDYRKILESGMVTNSEFVRKLEQSVAEYVRAKHCVALANCTSGLILAVKALGIKDGEALLPSFTFPATAHAVKWNRLRIRLVDCDPETFTVDLASLKERITEKSRVIIPVHVFGNPCDVKGIAEIAMDHDLRVIYDSAHAFGSTYRGNPIGQFGDAEVFSGSPTKAFTTVEGGLVTTNDSEIAAQVNIGRNYGHRGDYNCEMPGLSARMSELHAALGLNLLPYVASDIKKRNEIARQYEKHLGKLPGIGFQKIRSECTSTYKDFGITIDRDKFGLNRDALATALDKEHVVTRKYFYPPIHMQKCYPELKDSAGDLPNTNLISKKVLCLPMFSSLLNEQVNSVIETIKRIHTWAEEVRVAAHK